MANDLLKHIKIEMTIVAVYRIPLTDPTIQSLMMLRITPLLRLVFIAACFLTLTATQSAKAAVLATYDLNSATGTTLPVTPVAAGYTISPMSAIGVPGTAFSNHFYFNNWNATFNPAKYLSLTVGNPAAYRLTDISFSVETSVVAPATVIVRSSADGFASDIASFSWTNDLITDVSLSLASIGTRTGNTELRFYFLTPAAGTFTGIANHQPPGTGSGTPDIGVDVTLNGDLVTATAPASIPTLSEWALIFLSSIVAMFGLARMRLRR